MSSGEYAEDNDFINQAAALGIFAHIAHAEHPNGELQASIAIVLRRFAEYHDLQGAFGRRAITERAKGILVRRHSIDEQHAFTMLRERARTTQRKLVDIAESVIASHPLPANRGEERTGDDPPQIDAGC